MRKNLKIRKLIVLILVNKIINRKIKTNMYTLALENNSKVSRKRELNNGDFNKQHIPSTHPQEPMISAW